MTHPEVPSQEITKWQVESLRATTFHVAGTIVPATFPFWRRVFDDEPEQVVTRPREGIIQQSGIIDGHQLVLIGMPNRVDWIAQGIVTPADEPLPAPPNLGLLPDALPPFLRVAGKWLDVSPGVIRLAFGAVLVNRVTDLASAYQELSRFLPGVTTDITDSPDFLYQINRPRTSRSALRLRIKPIN